MRVPRKKKKVAKKLKAKNDALVMAMAAMVQASSLVQMAIIGSTPNEIPALKIVKAVQMAVESNQAVAKCMAQIKPWTSYIKSY
jgi:hypothetical protein